MHILITKDGATKISKEVAGWAEAKNYEAQGFHVEELLEHNQTRPLSATEPDPQINHDLPDGYAESLRQASAPKPAPAVKKPAAKKRAAKKR